MNNTNDLKRTIFFAGSLSHTSLERYTKGSMVMRIRRVKYC